MKYRVALQESEEGFSVWVPGLPGCVSQGTTEEEALANIADAVREYTTSEPCERSKRRVSASLAKASTSS